MSTTRRTDTNTPINAGDGVERPGPGKAPTAFRLWHAGANPTDHGPTLFDARSARLLMAEQEERENRYSFDFNHGSLNQSAPPEAQRGAGSFMLEVRGGELWAVDCRWTAEARAGIEAGQWTSMSPAYDIERESGRVISFMNCALTNNPATWGATKLAATRIAANRNKGHMTAPHSFSDSNLRVLATCEDSETRGKARAELRKRGAMLSDPDTENGRALLRMQAMAGRGSRQNCVRREGRFQIFDPLTSERARELLRADGKIR